ncbi:MAG: polymerase subunit delta [Frankiales bacterium]|nr:polymerase subunit delta [Frankiales bacterium]
MRRKAPVDEDLPESDAFEGAPHPRDTFTLEGHKAAEQALLEAYRTGRLPQAWIIGGAEGIGKATLAWRFTKFLFAHPDPRLPAVQNAVDLTVDPQHPSVRRVTSLSHGDLLLLRREWNSSTKKHFSEIRMDDVRRALELFHHAAGEGGWRICIVDCAEDLNRSGANALLKIIEEPPPKSLFLVISHRPARILPTIRSRSRMLLLEPLTPDQVVSAVHDLGPPWSEHGADLDAAAQRCAGSVRQALRLLDSDRLALSRRMDTLLGALPAVDWREVHALADKITPAAALDDFEAAISSIFEWLDQQVHQHAGEGVGRLAPLAEVWEKAADAVREAEALNLDKRPLILSIFADLAAATGAARR